MRTDQQITNDFALSNTLLSDEKGNCPPNYNQSLLLEVLLNIREYLKDLKDDNVDIKEKLNEIKQAIEGQ